MSPVAYEDAGKCRVASGAWVGPYTGEQFNDPGRLDIDHMVPLGNAHQSGGWAWSATEKRRYANDLSYENHLIAVQASANRSKGNKSPADWRPPDRGYWCQYAVNWIVIKNTWRLTATGPEPETLGEMLGMCAPPRTLTVVRASPIETTEPTPPQTAGTPSPPLTPASTYASCDDAIAAGGPRVQGSSGSGRGFPAAKGCRAPATAMTTASCVNGEGRSAIALIPAMVVKCALLFETRRVCGTAPASPSQGDSGLVTCWQ